MEESAEKIEKLTKPMEKDAKVMEEAWENLEHGKLDKIDVDAVKEAVVDIEKDLASELVEDSKALEKIENEKQEELKDWVDGVLEDTKELEHEIEKKEEKFKDDASISLDPKNWNISTN